MRIDANMIEIGAMAIHQTVANRSSRARDWAQVPESLKRYYREEAQAAIEAAFGARGNG